MKRLIFSACMAAIGLLAAPDSHAQSTSGNVSWGPWSMNWSIENSAGISVRNVTFNGTTYLYKGSLPTIRVQYDYMCGPFADRFKWSVIETNPATGEKARIESTGSYLKVWVKAQIGSYRLTQGWYFYSNGQMFPFVESSGLQCSVNHRHHPYWRMDFDVGGPSSDEIRTYNSGVWTNWSYEFNQVKTAGMGWILQDLTANKFVWISPGGNDGTSDTFSTLDFAGRRYQWNEHEPWLPDSSGWGDQGDFLLNSNNGEYIYQTDVMAWYVGHLYHAAADGPDQWGYVGPTVTVY